MKKLKQMYRCMKELKYGNGKTTGCPTKTLGHDRQCGFTLVELVIVIAIVIILSVISVPIYRGYVDKAKWSEGYALLGTILSAQKAYFSEHGNFLVRQHTNDWTVYEPIFGIDARGNKYFTTFYVSGLSDREQYYFDAQTRKPADIQTPGKYSLLIQCNITKGVRFCEYPDGLDVSWY